MPVGYLCIDRLTVSGLPVPAAGPAAAARSPWGGPRGVVPAALTACVCALDPPGGLQNHPRLRTPPLPLSHAHTPNQHHAASVSSLNRGNFTPRSNPSPAPTDHSLSGEPASGSAQEPAHAQDNWLLNSNIPLETRCGVRGGRGVRDGRAETLGLWRGPAVCPPPGPARAAAVWTAA